MNAALLLKHFDRICDAVDAVPRLRQYILDLAVRGKLVEQDEKGESATQLLAHIRLERARTTRNGAAKREKIFPPISDGPYQLPPLWCWSQLSELGFLNPRNSASDGLRASFVPMSMISAEYGIANKHEVRLWGDIKNGYTHFAEGDVGLAKITPCFENGKSTVFRDLTGGIGAGTTELHIVRPILVSAEYIVIFLKSPHFIESGIPSMTGTAGQKRVPTEYFSYTPFPLPPLAEQHRIVAKVKELMALCDRLEESQQGREELKGRCSVATLERLDNSSSEEHGGTAARFFVKHLPQLTARPDQIKQIRQTVLNLAVRGILVSRTQDAHQAPTFVEFDVSALSGSMKVLALPAHWSVKALADIALSIVDCPHSTPKWTAEGELCVRTNQFKPGYLDLSDVRFVSAATYQERIQRLEPATNDILYSREGGILGVACRIPPDTKLCLGQRMMLIRSSVDVEPDFLEMVLNSPLITGIAREATTGGAAPRVNVATVKAYPIPLPPLDEQRAIVDRVTETMELCDHLEKQVTVVKAESRKLLEAVLKMSLMPKDPEGDFKTLAHLKLQLGSGSPRTDSEAKVTALNQGGF